MRRIVLLILLMAASFSNTGCLLNVWSANPNERTQQLMVWSENLRQIKGEWARFWFMDQPSHMTWDRTDGGISPRY